MSKQQAHQILDAVRAGVDVRLDVINLALAMTGDLCAVTLH